MNRISLKEIAIITMGQSPEAKFVSIENIGLPLLNGPAEFTSRYPIPVQFTSKSKRTAIENDILFCVRGSTTGRMNIADRKYAIGRGLAAIRHKEDPKLNVYIKALIEVNLKKLLGGTLGSVFPNLTKEALFDLECFIHEDEQQRKIAAFLSTIDNKIELNNKINAELEQMAKTLYDYWFVQFDFPSAKGNPYKSSGGKMVYNEMLNRDVPEGWEAGTLQDLAYLNPTLSLKKNGASQYLDMAAIPTSGYVTQVPHLKEFTGGVKFQNGDIVVARITPCLENGKTALITMLENDNIGFGSTEFVNIRGKNKHSISFLAILSRSESFRSYAISKMTGTSGRKRVEAKSLAIYSLPIPPKNLLENFGRIIDPFFEKMTINQKENQQLASLRDWLLPMLMNAQIKVLGGYKKKEDLLSIDAEAEYQKRTQLNIAGTKKGFAKQVLAGKIISLFKNDPHFTDIKFQKIQFLAEHIIQADLNLNYYYQAAGPYDNVFMHTIYNDLKRNKWYDCKDRKFTELEKQVKIEEYYQSYFGPAINQLDMLFRLLSGATEAKAEIIATIYAVWNNFIIEGRPVAESELIRSFYDWSERKHQYTQAQVMEGIQWLRANHLEPTGFGKLIKKAKSRK